MVIFTNLYWVKYCTQSLYVQQAYQLMSERLWIWPFNCYCTVKIVPSAQWLAEPLLPWMNWDYSANHLAQDSLKRSPIHSTPVRSQTPPPWSSLWSWTVPPPTPLTPAGGRRRSSTSWTTGPGRRNQSSLTFPTIPRGRCRTKYGGPATGMCTS